MMFTNDQLASIIREHSLNMILLIQVVQSMDGMNEETLNLLESNFHEIVDMIDENSPTLV